MKAEHLLTILNQITPDKLPEFVPPFPSQDRDEDIAITCEWLKKSGFASRMVYRLGGKSGYNPVKVNFQQEKSNHPEKKKIVFNLDAVKHPKLKKIEYPLEIILKRITTVGSDSKTSLVFNSKFTHLAIETAVSEDEVWRFDYVE